MQTPLNLASVASASFLASHLPSSAPLCLAKDIKMSLTSQRRLHLTAVVCLEVVRLKHLAFGTGPAISDIHKIFNGLYTPFGSPVIGGQKPYKRMVKTIYWKHQTEHPIIKNIKQNNLINESEFDDIDRFSVDERLDIVGTDLYEPFSRLKSGPCDVRCEECVSCRE